jgi:hypothetical protein
MDLGICRTAESKQERVARGKSSGERNFKEATMQVNKTTVKGKTQ